MARARVEIAFLLLLVLACKKERKSELTTVYLDAGNDEPSALCREVYPCPPQPEPMTHLPDMCSLSGERSAPAKYSAPGVRIERLFCRYTKMGEEAVVGIPLDGSPHLRGADLFTRVRGTPSERAYAAAELLLEREHVVAQNLKDPIRTESCPVVEEGDALRFCVEASDPWMHRCVAYPNGAVTCSRDGSEPPLAACRRTTGRERVTAVEVFHERLPSPLASSMSAIPGNHLSPGDRHGATSIALRAGSLKVRSAICSDQAPYRGDTHYAFWGEDLQGRLVLGADLIPLLDDVTMRAAVVVDALPPSYEQRGAWIVLDRDDGKKNDPSDPSTCLPPGPRETKNGTIELYTTTGTTIGPEFRRCTISPKQWKGACEIVERRSFC